MTAITYTSTRSIMSGHTLNDVQSLDMDMQAIDFARKRNATRNKSLSGLSETWLANIDESWSFTTDWMDQDSDAWKQMQEFLDSCAAGEQFTIDPYGSVAVPAAPLVCEVDSDSYNATRNGARLLQISFVVRVL